MCDYTKINWELLRAQKLDLLFVISDLEERGKLDPVVGEWVDSLTGILHLIDHFQDCAVDSGLYTEHEVLALTEDP
jgi:hypothetical protein